STVVLPLQNGRASRVSTASAHVLDAHESVDVGVLEPVFGDAGREVEPSTGRAGCDGCYSRRRETFIAIDVGHASRCRRDNGKTYDARQASPQQDSGSVLREPRHRSERQGGDAQSRLIVIESVDLG